MAIQTEITLQPDYYVLPACDGETIPHCRNLFYHPSYTIVIVFEHILRLVVLTFCPQGGVTSRHSSL